MAKDRAAPKPKGTTGGSTPSGTRRRTPRAGDLKVRRMHRSVEDGYEHALLPGVRASDDARRLADELAFATARLAELRDDPPGLLADAALAPDREEGLWTTFLVAYLSPLEEAEDPFAAIDAVRTTWASGELPALDGVQLGPRAAHDPRRGTDTLEAYRARAAKAGGQELLLSAESSLTPARRFERAFERLSLPRFPRAARYEFLVLAGGLGLLDVEPSSLLLASAEAMDPVLLAAKRILGIGDAINLQRRASELLAAADVRPAALDLALINWARPPGERITAGSRAQEDPEVRARVAAALGVADEEDEDSDVPDADADADGHGDGD
jgi:hypothetical protein